MKYVYSWLKDYVDLDGIGPDELAARWTLVGLEVEGVTKIGDWWDRERIVVGGGDMGRPRIPTQIGWCLPT